MVDRKGSIFLEAKPVSIQGLVQHLRGVKEIDSFRPIIITGDRESNYGVSLAVLDKVRYIGFENVYLSTQ